MNGLTQVGQFHTTGDDGRSHVVFIYQEGHAAKATPHFITNEGWEVAPIRDGVFRVYGTGLLLRGAAPIAK